MIRAACASLLVFVLATVLTVPVQSQVSETDARHTLALHEQELELVDILLKAAQAYAPKSYMFRHVSVVDVANGKILPDMRVEVDGGHIVAISPDSDAPSSAIGIDGAGKFLAPGLADMHVHIPETVSVQLLNIALGVTTLRDMDGLPWMLRWRQQSRENSWIGPDLIVAGHIISSIPLEGGYATVVKSADEARRVVDQQKEMGFDYIKVHNILPLSYYDAVADECRRLHIGLVGHVPQSVTVTHAIASGQQTLEHFKGYISDRTLLISKEDWVTPTEHSAVWNTPTLYTYRIYERGPAAERWFASEESNYVPDLIKSSWKAIANETVTPEESKLFENEQDVLRRLLPHTHRFLAGTDSGGGYQFMVPGFALYEELRLLNETGLSTLETLRTATLYAAEATGRQGEFGQVAVGLDANLVLSAKNPIEHLETLRKPVGVMIRGRWLDRKALDDILATIVSTYSKTSPVATDPNLPNAAWTAAFRSKIDKLRKDGYVFPDNQIAAVNSALLKLNQTPVQ